jgi:hypothetical protein
MTIEANVRAALMPALERDLRRRRPRRSAVAVALLIAATATTGVAAATGVIFAPPKPDGTVPAVAEWTYYAHDPFGGAHDGAVLMRHRPEALQRLNREAEALLARNGVTARCGTDPDHPRACFLPSGAPVPGAQLGPVLSLSEGPADYDVKALSAAEAHAWLCAHPAQRPGADGGELRAPPMDC